jgi:endonuclease YncB( thermonuclease family)
VFQAKRHAMRFPNNVLTAAAAIVAAAIFYGSAAAELRRGAEVVAEHALDGDTLALAGGRALRLAGILAPKAADRGREREIAEAMSAARAALERLARGKTLALWHGDLAEDRHARIFAYAQTAEGLWLQDELLRLGHARVFSQPGDAERAAAMLKLEAEARIARRGLWARSAYRVLGDGEAGRFVDSFQIVEGRVLKAAPAREYFYLNFGRDFRRDFTIGLDRAALRLFRRAGLAPASLEGKRVRVRGWLLWRNGPYIGATHPEQVEVIE